MRLWVCLYCSVGTLTSSGLETNIIAAQGA